MSELFKSKFIDEFIKGLFSIDKINRTSKCELKDIVRQLVTINNTPFDAGVLFLHDQVKHSFSCRGIFSREGEYNETKKVIDEKLKFNECKLDEAGSTLKECGLYCFVAKKFKEGCGEDEHIYVAINDVDEFMKKDELAKYYINIDFNEKKVKSEYVFPVYIKNEKPCRIDEACQKILHAVIVLVSFKNTNISRDELKLLSDLISYRILVEVKKVADEAFNQFINRLSCFESVSYGKNEYQKSFELLNDLYSHRGKDDEENTLKHCFLKHASLWSLNDTEKEKKFLVKEKNLTPPTDTILSTNLITHENIPGTSSPHYFYQFITGQIKKISDNGKTIQFSDMVEVARFKEIKNQFREKDRFQKIYNIMDDDIAVLFPVIPHFENELKNNEDAIKNIGLMVLYFDRNTFSYYYNPMFLEIMSHKIYENIKISISKARRAIRKSIFAYVSDLFKNEKDFYSKAADVIKEKLDFEYCLIYLFNEERKGVELKNVINHGKNDLFPESVDFSEADECDFFTGFVNGKSVSERLTKYIVIVEKDLHNNEPFIWCHKNLQILDDKKNFLFSMMVMALKDSENRSIGVLICLNNRRNINTPLESERSFFSSRDYEISSIGAETISSTTVIFQNATISGKILKRLAHEIPTQSGFIMQNIREIQDVLSKVADRIDESTNKHIANLLDQQIQAASRMQLFSEYARFRNINEINLNVEKEELNMKIFLSSIINGFRSDAQKYGVFVEFDILSRHHLLNVQSIQVHPLFKLAIWNLINNAIQYSYFGTIVLITAENDLDHFYIHVENIGIPLYDEFKKKKIYEENFRSKEAKKKFFKGTGLGLYFAKQIVRVHDGEILVQTNNNFCTRNIFGIFEIQDLLKEMKSDSDREKYINRNRNSLGRKSYDHFRKEIELTPEEMSVIEKYRKFQICKSNRAEYNYSRNYLEKIFRGNENLGILFRKQVNNPISYVKFTIKLKRSKI